MTDALLPEFKTGPTPARYMMFAKVSKKGELVGNCVRQQRVRHAVYSSPNSYKVLAQLLALRNLTGQKS